MPSSIVSAGLGIWQSSEEQDAQEYAQNQAELAQYKQQKQTEAAQKRAQQEAAARTPAELKQRKFNKDSTNTRLRGIQATMLASRKAQNADAGGKTKLGE